MKVRSAETQSLLGCQDRRRREAVLAEIFMRHRKRLRNMVELRLHPRLKGRLDPSDVLQEAFLEAVRRLDAFLLRPLLPVFLWLRMVTGHKLFDLHAHHLKAGKRSLLKEAPLRMKPMPEASTAMVAARFVRGGRSSPSDVAVRAEERERVHQALDSMEPIDREVLLLRAFEGLSAAETARALDIGADAERKRYFRALKRLRAILRKSGGGEERRGT
jgi:RNA polymerase sigma-70 factor (ECF subfamily)